MPESDKREARINVYETDFGDHYSVNMKDSNGKVVATKVTDDIQEARFFKEKWENGEYQYIAD